MPLVRILPEDVETFNDLKRIKERVKNAMPIRKFNNAVTEFVKTDETARAIGTTKYVLLNTPLGLRTSIGLVDIAQVLYDNSYLFENSIYVNDQIILKLLNTASPHFETFRQFLNSDEGKLAIEHWLTALRTPQAVQLGRSITDDFESSRPHKLLGVKSKEFLNKIFQITLPPNINKNIQLALYLLHLHDLFKLNQTNGTNS